MKRYTLTFVSEIHEPESVQGIRVMTPRGLRNPEWFLKYKHKQKDIDAKRRDCCATLWIAQQSKKKKKKFLIFFVFVFVCNL
jgi:hypothetical protein